MVVRAFEVTVVHTWRLEEWYALLGSPVVLLIGLSVALSFPCGELGVNPEMVAHYLRQIKIESKPSSWPGLAVPSHWC